MCASNQSVMKVQCTRLGRGKVTWYIKQIPSGVHHQVAQMVFCLQNLYLHLTHSAVDQTILERLHING